MTLPTYTPPCSCPAPRFPPLPPGFWFAQPFPTTAGRVSPPPASKLAMKLPVPPFLFGRSCLRSESLLSAHDFRALLQKERVRIDRSGGELALLLVKLPADYERTELPREVVRWLMARLRTLDEIGWIDQRRFALVLPATSQHGALHVWSELRQGDVTRFLKRCEASLYVHPGAWSHLDSKDADDDDHGSNGSSGRSNGVAHGAYDDLTSNVPFSATNGSAATMCAPVRVEANGHFSPRATPLRAPVAPLADLLVQSTPLGKRCLDVLVSATCLILLAPVFAIAAIAVKLSSPGPIFFAQPRGARGRTFPFYKFRTMYVGSDARKEELAELNEQSGPVFKMTNDPRITPVGRILRKTSIDELPQLWNVFKGDMSLVGPRPPIPEETLGYERWQLARLEALGGLTCIWQVSGRSNVCFEDWVRMDIQYLRKRSLWLDLTLLLKTLPAVLTARGAR
jgi:lipopolysaccharide/colanic/teichoic acid biosynthesis glycosyltransferase